MPRSFSGRVLSVLLPLVGLQAACQPEPASKPVAPEQPALATAKAVDDACAFPTKPSASLEETAWRTFVAATCASGNAALPLVFETWTEQTCIVDPSAKGCSSKTGEARQLHGSHLRELAAKVALGLPPIASECSSMTVKGTSTQLDPYVPTNLASSPTFCEEVFANAAELAYIQAPAPGQSLTTLSGQSTYVKAGNTIDFPNPSVEIKADWLPASSLASSAFDCASPPAGLYTEVIQGQCYALVGLHVSSKLYPNWLWATFEPQISSTNPNRCNPSLYNSCSDPWGSTPATSTGADTAQTQELAALMKAAGLPAAFSNYRLVGVQIDYVGAQTTPLGNSFTEFNAQVAPQQASCITCHSYAEFNDAVSPAAENPNFGAFPGTPATGVPSTTVPPLPTGSWQSQDRSWLLGILPAGS